MVRKQFNVLAYWVFGLTIGNWYCLKFEGTDKFLLEYPATFVLSMMMLFSSLLMIRFSSPGELERIRFGLWSISGVSAAIIFTHFFRDKVDHLSFLCAITFGTTLTALAIWDTVGRILGYPAFRFGIDLDSDR
jgi:hypothetical protein